MSLLSLLFVEISCYVDLRWRDYICLYQVNGQKSLKKSLDQSPLYLLYIILILY